MSEDTGNGEDAQLLASKRNDSWAKWQVTQDQQPSVIPNRKETQQLSELIGTERWQNLAPNFPSPTALFPRELTVEQIEALTATIADPATIAELQEFGGSMMQVAQDALGEKRVPNVGTLTKLTPGEASLPYVLTTDDGKKLAVLLSGYSPSLGLQIPEDPKMVQIARKGVEDVWEYSDLRTYLLSPVAGTAYAVKLQEFGGQNNTTEHLPHGRSLLRESLIRMAKQHAQNYIKMKGFDPSDPATQGELNHSRHYLFNRGATHLPAIIDVPVVDLKTHHS